MPWPLTINFPTYGFKMVCTQESAPHGNRLFIPSHTELNSVFSIETVCLTAFFIYILPPFPWPKTFLGPWLFLLSSISQSDYQETLQSAFDLIAISSLSWNSCFKWASHVQVMMASCEVQKLFFIQFWGKSNLKCTWAHAIPPSVPWAW